MDQVKKSVVKQVQANGTWDGQYGLFYKWAITLENGDAGQYMSKGETQTKFVVGSEVAYTYDDTKKDFPKIKPFNEFQAVVSPGGAKGSPDIQEMIVRQSSLRSAVEFSKDTYDVVELLKVADTLVAWVLKKECCNKKSEVKTDLPF